MSSSLQTFINRITQWFASICLANLHLSTSFHFVSSLLLSLCWRNRKIENFSKFPFQFLPTSHSSSKMKENQIKKLNLRYKKRLFFSAVLFYFHFLIKTNPGNCFEILLLSFMLPLLFLFHLSETLWMKGMSRVQMLSWSLDVVKSLQEPAWTASPSSLAWHRHTPVQQASSSPQCF